MPRPRKYDPTSLITPIIREFAQQVAAAVERATIDRVQAATLASFEDLSQGRRSRTGGGLAKKLCYYPGCKNVAAPRFAMFCAALHKNLSKAEKEKYRAAHAAEEGAPAAPTKPLKRGRRKARA